ncbi:MAG: Bug family tripartite tricarboxylate transporter substrate binding protein [Alphaproteobacteria bacterium]
MRSLQKAFVAGVFCGVGAVGFSGATAAQSVEEFYKGKQVKLVIGAAVAGGYDTYGRLFARLMPKHIPGNPPMIVQIMPGAGGVVAANYLYNIAPKDGLTLGTVQRQIPEGPLVGLGGVQFDATKFNWIGSMNNEVSICVSWHTAAVKTFKDAFDKELIVGAQRQANTEQYPSIFNNLLGTKFKIIAGYTGGGGVLLAMERGEVEGRCSWSWSSIVVQKPDWLRDKKINLLAQISLAGHPDLPNVPLVMDFAKSDADRQVLEFLFARNVLGRPFLAPPGVPGDRVVALRAAFDAMVKDKDVVAEFKKVKQELTPVGGETIQNLMGRLYATPKDIIAKAKAATKWHGTVVKPVKEKKKKKN